MKEDRGAGPGFLQLEWEWNALVRKAKQLSSGWLAYDQRRQEAGLRWGRTRAQRADCWLAGWLGCVVAR